MSIVPSHAFSLNERFSVKRTLTMLETIYNKNIIKPLSRDYTNYLDFQQYLMNLPNTVEQMTTVLEKHVKTMIKLEIQKGVQFSTLDKYEMDALYNQLMDKSWYKQSLTNVVTKIQEKITYAMMNNTGIDLQFLQDELTKIGSGQFFNMRRILLTESQTVLNNTKEAIYRKEEEEFGEEFLYKWVIGKDKRTSIYCKEIESIVNSEGGAVTLNRLKVIVKQVSIKYMPADYVYRDWTPHYNCRSSFIRVIL